MGGGGCCVSCECECEGADRPGWSRATIVTLEKRVTFLSAVCAVKRNHMLVITDLTLRLRGMKPKLPKPQLGPITQFNCENILHMQATTKWTLGSSEWNKLDIDLQRTGTVRRHAS